MESTERFKYLKIQILILDCVQWSLKPGFISNHQSVHSSDLWSTKVSKLQNNNNTVEDEWISLNLQHQFSIRGNVFKVTKNNNLKNKAAALSTLLSLLYCVIFSQAFGIHHLNHYQFLPKKSTLWSPPFETGPNQSCYSDSIHNLLQFKKEVCVCVALCLNNFKKP